MVETINKVIRVSRQLLQELGQDPSAEEIAAEMGMPVDKVREIMQDGSGAGLPGNAYRRGGGYHLGDFIPDDDASEPSEAAASLLKGAAHGGAQTLTPREKRCLSCASA